MRHKARLLLLENTVVYHRESYQTANIYFVQIARLSQFLVRDFPIQGHLRGDVPLVDCLQRRTIELDFLSVVNCVAKLFVQLTTGRVSIAGPRSRS